jgi:2-dehydro-3-deoxygluconokinase
MTSEKFGIPAVALTIRGSISAEVNDWSAMLYVNKTPYFSKQYRINLVDRIGGGDAFSAGLIYSLAGGYDPQAAVDFAAAAAVLAQTTEYDTAESSPDEINALARGASDGRVQR